MSGSHGRMGRTGIAWLGTALAASGLLIASGPARACHIRHDTHPAREQATPTSASPDSMPATSDAFDKAGQDFPDHWRPRVPTTPPRITPTAATATPPAAEMLASAPTVANQGTSQPCGCPPPPPPCSGTIPTTPTPPNQTPVTPPASPTPPNQTPVTPPASQTLSSPAPLLNPTPTPEPSTVLSAIAMIGAVAWRRRAARPRG